MMDRSDETALRAGLRVLLGFCVTGLTGLVLAGAFGFTSVLAITRTAAGIVPNGPVYLLLPVASAVQGAAGFTLAIALVMGAERRRVRLLLSSWITALVLCVAGLFAAPGRSTEGAAAILFVAIVGAAAASVWVLERDRAV